jgi:hypothetical protein
MAKCGGDGGGLPMRLGIGEVADRRWSGDIRRWLAPLGGRRRRGGVPTTTETETKGDMRDNLKKSSAQVLFTREGRWLLQIDSPVAGGGQEVDGASLGVLSVGQSGHAWEEEGGQLSGFSAEQRGKNGGRRKRGPNTVRPCGGEGGGRGVGPAARGGGCAPTHPWVARSRPEHGNGGSRGGAKTEEE